jgi:hypothetical protein
MRSGDKLTFAGNILIEACSELQDKWDTKFTYGKQYAKEVCTVRCGSSRRSGHDYAAARLIRDNFSMVFYITPTEDMMKIARNECMAIGGTDRVVFATIHNFLNSKFDGIQFDAVFVNPASAIDPNKIDLIYERTLPMLGSKPKKYWVLVG